ncbi:type IV pilus biogenesis/stability protein PilW [Thalassolituus sp. LLYu03]|uniref:type IV pilus biogenesis/stability protein PilW n=1 Tax=Thalassolituus sp. LLYu03 TaxID=3421656 RepID=UPI003D2D7B3B
MIRKTVLFRLSLACVLSAALASCVTVTESRFTKKASPEKAVENYTQLGLGYLKNGHPDLARQRLQKALTIDDDYAPANDAMGLVWQSEGEYDYAEESFKKALSADPSMSLARHHLGRLYSQNKRYKDAEQYLKAAADDRYYENRASAFNDLAMNFYRQGKTEPAIEAFGQTLRLAPYNAEALVNASTLMFEAGRYDESYKYFDRFERLVQRKQSQHNAHTLWLGIKLANVRQDTKSAVAMATELKRNFPNSNEYRQYQDSLSGAK